LEHFQCAPFQVNYLQTTWGGASGFGLASARKEALESIHCYYWKRLVGAPNRMDESGLVGLRKGKNLLERERK
jgi:hypothetical protein